MTRVLHVLRTLEVGGAELIALEIARWSRENGIAATVSSEPGPLGSRLPPGVELLGRSPGSFAHLVAGVLRHARMTGADVLHAHQRREALACVVVARALRRQAVEHVHTLIPSRRGKSLSFRSAVMFAVSESIAEMVVGEFGRDPRKVVVVRNVPVSIDPAALPQPREAHGTLRLLGVGRLQPQKDPLRFVRVVAAIAKRQPVQARWVGDGPLREEVVRAASGLPCEFVGTAQDLTSELLSADALLMTSAWEGLPLVALEAMALGTPVVATAVGGLGAVLEDEGTGLAVNPAAEDDEFADLVLSAVAPSPLRTARIARGRSLIDIDLQPRRGVPASASHLSGVV